MKTLDIKIYILFNVVNANNTISSCFFFFLIIDSYCKSFKSCCKTCNSNRNKEAKAEIAIHPVTAETKTRKCSALFRVV